MKLHAATGSGHRDAGHSGQEGAGHQRDIKQRILSLAVGPCCLQRRMGFWEYYSPIFGTFVSIFIGGRGIGVIQFRRAGGHITSVFDSDHESGVLGGVGSAGAYTSAGDVIICCLIRPPPHSPTHSTPSLSRPLHLIVASLPPRPPRVQTTLIINTVTAILHA